MSAATTPTAAPAATGPGGSTVEALQLGRQNAYLKLRCAQMQEDVTNLNAHVIRLQQELERMRGQRPPLAGSR
jgi:hypothetical protein